MSEHRALSHDEIQSLLGAYALDAVDPWERDVVDAHVRDCPRCRAEIAEHREVASLLANSGADAPAGVWDRITGVIEGDRAPGAGMAPVDGIVGAPRQAGRGTQAGRARWSRAPGLGRRSTTAAVARGALAAAAVVALALLGWRVVDQGDRIDRLQTALERGGVTQAALAASSNPDARTVELVTTGGDAVATAVVLPDGTGYLVRDRLDRLADDRTYQLWAVVGERVISAGVLGNDPSVLAFRAPSEATAFAVTDEVAGGVVRTQQDPVASGELRSA